MNSSDAAHKPSDLEPEYKGEVRTGYGYQYWTTNEEDETALTIREQVAQKEAEGGEVEPAKKPRRRRQSTGVMRRTFIRLAVLALFAVLLGMLYMVVNYVQVSNASDRVDRGPADALVVLGAAQYDGSPSRVLQERLDHAFNLYEEGVADLIFVTGGGAEGDRTTEGLAGYNHLLEKGVPEADLEVIPEGTNSYEQISATAFQVQERELESVILVSDDYHTYRLLDIADEIMPAGVDVFVSPSANEGTFMSYARESVAVGIGRVLGYRRLSSITER